MNQPSSKYMQSWMYTNTSMSMAVQISLYMNMPVHGQVDVNARDPAFVHVQAVVGVVAKQCSQ